MKRFLFLSLFLLLSHASSAWAQSGWITTSQNPCTVPAGQSSCTVAVTWHSSGGGGQGLFLVASPPILVNGDPNNSTYNVTWLSQGVSATLELRASYADANSALLDSVTVSGSSPTGDVVASPETCAIPAGSSSCSSTITWSTQNALRPGVFIRETGVLVSGTPTIPYTADWINTTGYHFDLRNDYNDVNSQLLDSVFVRGQVSNDPPISGPFILGAIRWDGWFGDPTAPEGIYQRDLTRDLASWSYRLPFFTTYGSPMAVRSDNPAVMDQEINYANLGGIGYWAFVHYPGMSGRYTTGLNLYLASGRADKPNFALIIGADTSNWATQVETIASMMNQAKYQKVAGGRPLMFILGLKAFGDSFNGCANNCADARAALAQISTRYQQLSQTPNVPFFVGMALNQPGVHVEEGVAYKSLLQLDAGSVYASQHEYSGVRNATAYPYSYLADAHRANRNAWAGSVVPSVSAGWDPRPRWDNPEPTEGIYPKNGLGAWYATPTPTELACEVKDAKDWLAQPGRTGANTALIYAWNEIDEGGWLLPTQPAQGGPINTTRLQALGQVMSGGPCTF